MTFGLNKLHTKVQNACNASRFWDGYFFRQ